ncbi:outer membrane protein assembly factor BamB family protein [Halogeometricum limi]|uniref:Outer membrane protein assembly factor BamB, contains PQQ-like beta-propeller repeat n=1 Tax=Halogeometricum limi TaxID=555875 RepID=A0A1I6HJL0_9EURY|nr:PQQ-binding-like beta-propeller repeat protein [Halogeometricum limi]SFR54669.1 Outer membrane protein assembly factor BamB, contains PQQ-like beta-propeller repeat [Halogeometricum limi]
MPSHRTSTRRRFLSAVGATTLAAFAGCTGTADRFDGTVGDGVDDVENPTADWPLPNFDAAATAYNPSPVGPTEKPTERWRVDSESTPTARVTVVGDTAYVPTWNALLALSTKDGSERWRVGPIADGERSPSPYFTGASVSNGTVYVGTHDDRGVLALDAETGEERWRYRNDGRYYATAPLPIEEGDYVATGDDRGHVAVLDAETGDPEWTFDAFGAVEALAGSLTTLYVGTESGEVYALYRGRGMWRRKLPGAIRALAAQGSTLHVGTFGGGVFRLRGGAHTGRTEWHAEDGFVAHRGMSLADGILVGSDLARSQGIETETGRVRWQVEGDFGTPPAASHATAYLGGGSGVVAVALDGGVGVEDARVFPKRWTFSTDSAVESGVTVADDALFFATSGREQDSPRVYALE